MVWITHLISLTLTFPTSKRSVAKRTDYITFQSNLILFFGWVPLPEFWFILDGSSVVGCGWIVAFCYIVGIHKTGWMLRAVKCKLGGNIFAYLSACLKTKPQPCWEKVAWCDRTSTLYRDFISAHHKTSMLIHLSILNLNDRLSWVSVAEGVAWTEE